MTDRVVVNRDRTALLPPNSPEKGYRITREEAAELGLVDSAEKPKQERRAAFDATQAKAPPTQRRRSAARKPRK
jgi:hypothetical protein